MSEIILGIIGATLGIIIFGFLMWLFYSAVVLYAYDLSFKDVIEACKKDRKRK